MHKLSTPSLNRIKKPKLFYGYIIAIAAFFITAVAWGTMYNFGLFFQPLLTEFGWTRAGTSGAYSLSFFLYGLFSIIGGRLTDRFGPRIIVMISGLLVGLGYLLMSQVHTIWQLYILYGALIGIGMSGTYVPLISAVSRWFTKRRGLMSGIVVSGVGFGGVIMPPIASQLILNYGWRNAYIIFGALVLAVIIIAAQCLRPDPRQVGLLPYGEIAAKSGNSGSEAQGFSIQEAIHTKQFWVLFVAYLFYGTLVNGVIVHIVPHAVDIGVSAVSAVSILSVIGGLTIAGGLLLGGTSDRIGKKQANIIAFVLMAVALFVLIAARELWMFYLFAVLFGFGWGGVSALMSPAVAELFGLKAHGAILGMVLFISTVGGGIGPLVAGRIFDITGSYQLVFLICAVFSVAGLILASLLRPIGRGSLV